MPYQYKVFQRVIFNTGLACSWEGDGTIMSDFRAMFPRNWGSADFEKIYQGVQAKLKNKEIV